MFSLVDMFSGGSSGWASSKSSAEVPLSKVPKPQMLR